MKKLFPIALVAAMLATFGTSAFAGKKLTADELKTAIIGKTVHAVHHIKGFEFKAYFAPNGDLLRSGAKNGTYSIKKDGKHCVDFGGGNKCVFVEKNDDGTLSRVNKKGKKAVTWSKIVDGKHL